jgi:hypothetical protein
MAKRKGKAGEYDAYRESQLTIVRERAAAGMEVGPIPPVRDVRRRNACLDDFRLFCESYFPQRFTMAWSADHLRCLSLIQAAGVEGGQFAFAMPRGSGKTSLCECAALWAVLYGHRSFVVMMGATEGAAVELLASVKAEIEGNDLLAADFPEVCHPVRMLEGQTKRAIGQVVDGARTRILWKEDKVILPTVRGSASSGVVLMTTGITGRIRGMKHTTADGTVRRPDLVIIDDPSTDESAASPTQNAKRERLLSGAVLGLAGPRVKISAIMPCTVIAPDDMADRILNRDTHPEWNGERTKMIYAFPTNQGLWDEYAEVRANSMREGRGLADATAFYRANRPAMDEGAKVAWPERFNPDELSAVQHAMNRKLADHRAFMAECQNDPEKGDLGAGAKELNATAVAGRLSGLERYAVPKDAAFLTAFVDVGIYLHWYAVVAWNERFGGSVVDYGCWPRQSRTMFAAADARPTLKDYYAGPGKADLTHPQLVYAGLKDLTAEILGRVYYRENGGEVAIDRCLIDSGKETKAVEQFVRQSPHRHLLYASKGVARTKTAAGVMGWKVRPGERRGHYWRLTVGETGRVVQFDTDHWKSFLFGRLTVAPGTAEWLGFWGRAAGVHALIGEHCAAEYATPWKQETTGVTFDKWEDRPNHPDNHVWDCLVGAAVAASVAGCVVGAAPAGEPKPDARRAVRMSELQAAKKGRQPLNAGRGR